VPIFLKSGSLNILKPYGPVKVCNGIDKSILSVYNLCFAQKVIFIPEDDPQERIETCRNYSVLILKLCLAKVRKKLNFTLEQATKTQRWSRGIALLFL
jgi:hypothetical protein